MSCLAGDLSQAIIKIMECKRVDMEDGMDVDLLFYFILLLLLCSNYFKSFDLTRNNYFTKSA